MVVYFDVVFLENIVMNYLILLLTARFSKSNTTNLRLFLGALVGAAYVIFMLIPGVNIPFTTAARIILSVVIIAVAFSPEKPGSFLKVLAIFYLSTFIFGGSAFAVIFMTQGGGLIKNGVFMRISELKWYMVYIYAAALAVIIIRIFLDIVRAKLVREKLLIPLKISFENKYIDLPALVDTGNSLHDPLSNLPVIVVEFKAIKEILPEEIQRIFEEAVDNDLKTVTEIVSESSWFSRFRLIPFSSLGKENGMLIGFKPDMIEIGLDYDKKGVSNVIVGIYNRALSGNENYRALLSPELVG